MNRFVQDRVWRTIRDAAKRARVREVAVAYLGEGASRLLPLRRGDTLVVDMSLGAVKSGVTNPWEVDRYLRAGVEVFNRPNLHAKVFVLGRVAIIGSANVSNSSNERLIEAVVETTDPAVVSRARGFVRSHCGEAVEPSYVKLCKSVWRPPRVPAAKGRSRDDSGPRGFSRHWVAAVAVEDPEPNVERIRRAQNKRGKLEARRGEQVDTFWWKGETAFRRNVEKGHCVILIVEDEDGTVYVEPPGRVVGVRREDRTRLRRTFVTLATRTRDDQIAFARLRKAAATAGASITVNSTKELRSTDAVHAIRGLWK